MPELPEVETVCRGLELLLPGRAIVQVTCDWPKALAIAAPDLQRWVIGARFVAVTRRGKLIVAALDNGHSLAIHLRMTGQLVFVGDEHRPASREFVAAAAENVGSGAGGGYGCAGDTDSGGCGGHAHNGERGSGAGSAGSDTGKPPARFGGGHPSDSLVDRLPDRSTRVIFSLGGPPAAPTVGARLFFNDQRKFGRVELIAPGALDEHQLVRRLGPEPLSAQFTAAVLGRALARRSRSAIKAVLLDQSTVAGIGNIYADEALWSAGVHPARLAGALGEPAVAALWQAIRAVLTLSIEQGGSTDRNYVDAEGRRGAYLDFAAVFRRQGQGCRRCGTTIIKIRCCGRGTHLCPTCQPPP